MKGITIKSNGRKANLEKGGHLDWQFVSRFDFHEYSGTDILVITQPIVLKPSLFARLGRNYIVRVKTQADDSLPRIKYQLKNSLPVYWNIYTRDLSPPQKVIFKYLASRCYRVSWYMIT